PGAVGCGNVRIPQNSRHSTGIRSSSTWNRRNPPLPSPNPSTSKFSLYPGAFPSPNAGNGIPVFQSRSSPDKNSSLWRSHFPSSQNSLGCARPLPSLHTGSGQATLGQRLQDIQFWRVELQKEIMDLDNETNMLAAQKLRLERALDATEVPYAVVIDNLECRDRRQPPDLVIDEVERQLLKVGTA
uniref:Tektin n=1 Tax=Cyanistes caeruleus TaxID=156563 RepID=A0A8C0VPL2_CYACU